MFLLANLFSVRLQRSSNGTLWYSTHVSNLTASESREIGSLGCRTAPLEGWHTPLEGWTSPGEKHQSKADCLGCHPPSWGVMCPPGVSCVPRGYHLTP